MADTEATKNPSTWRFGDFRLQPERAALLKGDREVKLRPKVYDALQYLIANRGRVVPKEELIQALWPEAFVTDDSLVQCMVELRRALDDRAQEILKTVPRRGYIFAAEVDTDQSSGEAWPQRKPPIAAMLRQGIGCRWRALPCSAASANLRRSSNCCSIQRSG